MWIGIYWNGILRIFFYKSNDNYHKYLALGRKDLKFWYNTPYRLKKSALKKSDFFLVGPKKVGPKKLVTRQNEQLKRKDLKILVRQVGLKFNNI